MLQSLDNLAGGAEFGFEHSLEIEVTMLRDRRPQHGCAVHFGRTLYAEANAFQSPAIQVCLFESFADRVRQRIKKPCGDARRARMPRPASETVLPV